MAEQSVEPTSRLNGAVAMVVLKWVAAIAGVVIGGLLVVILMGTAGAVVGHGNRLTALETQGTNDSRALDRIEAKLVTLEGKIDGLK